MELPPHTESLANCKAALQWAAITVSPGHARDEISDENSLVAGLFPSINTFPNQPFSDEVIKFNHVNTHLFNPHPLHTVS